MGDPRGKDLTGAELKTLREALGLTVQELAGLGKVQLRSAQYWESGKYNVPDDVAELLSRIDKRFDELAIFNVQKILESGLKPDLVTLTRYQSDKDLRDAHPDMTYAGVAHHAALVDRSRRRLEDAGYKVEIIYSLDQND